MKSSPQLKTDYPAFENKHALQPIVPSLEPSSQVASDGICARCIKTIHSIFYMKGPAKKTIKKKKNNLPDFKDCSPFPRFHLRQFRDQLILLVTVALQFDGGEFCLREWFLKVLSDTPQTSVYICSLSAAETSTERGRNPIINKQISPCMVTYQRAWFDSKLINKIKSFFSEYRK